MDYTLLLPLIFLIYSFWMLLWKWIHIIMKRRKKAHAQWLMRSLISRKPLCMIQLLVTPYYDGSFIETLNCHPFCFWHRTADWLNVPLANHCNRNNRTFINNGSCSVDNCCKQWKMWEIFTIQSHWLMFMIYCRNIWNNEWW